MCTIMRRGSSPLRLNAEGVSTWKPPHSARAQTKKKDLTMHELQQRTKKNPSRLHDVCAEKKQTKKHRHTVLNPLQDLQCVSVCVWRRASSTTDCELPDHTVVNFKLLPLHTLPVRVPAHRVCVCVCVCVWLLIMYESGMRSQVMSSSTSLNKQ